MPEHKYPSQALPRVTARLDEALYTAVHELAGEPTIDAVINAALQLWVAQRAPVPVVAATRATSRHRRSAVGAQLD